MHIVMLPLRLGALMMMYTAVPYINLWRIITQISTPSTRIDSSSATDRGSSSNSAATDGAASSRVNSTARLVYWYHPSDYWRHPAARNIIVVAQRLLPPLVAAASVSSSAVCTNWVRLDQEGSVTRQFMKYAFTGWSAAIMMVS